MESLQKRYSDQLESLRSELTEFLALHKFPHQTTDNGLLDEFLENSEMDHKLVRYILLYEATPKGLAEFASQGPQEEAWMHQLLSCEDDGATELLKEWLLADGPQAKSTGGGRNKKSIPQYGPAMRIYQSILAESANAREAAKTGAILHRLAMAIALVHAVPQTQRNPEEADRDDDQFVDPVRRYLNYEMAYLEGQLDPYFETLSTWELRFVVDGEEPDEISAWGRQMLCNYRPDHVLSQNYVWKYVDMVRSNIRYGSQDVKHDRPDLQFFQNILMNGGVCGRRAFFGRFILRAFGIPTTARPSPGHGALIHWTPDHDWVACLGGGFGSGSTKTRYKKDTDFLITATARRDRTEFWKVKRAQWYGDVFQEERIFGEGEQRSEQCPPFWYGVSLRVQNSIVEQLKTKSPASPQCHVGGNQKQTLAQRVAAATNSPSTKKIQYGSDGVIVIPAAAYTKPKQTKDVKVMKCFDGGFQIFLPAFQPQGLTIMRGGTFKSNANACASGRRLKSGGYGKYHDWGFRVAISGGDGESCPNKNLTVLVGRTNTVPIEFVFIKPGTFQMGGENKKDDRFGCVEVPKHQVALTNGFFLGKYPVTQAQYKAVTGSNPSKSTKSPNCPVDNIGVEEANDFCDKLVETIGKDFRLPTEAEWEYACRGGQGDRKWFFGDDPAKLEDYAWIKTNSGGKTHPVGEKQPNPFGVYDMYGNVYERVSDKYAKDYYAKCPSVDPTGPSQGTKSSFEYKVSVPETGNYSLAANVVTANEKQRLNVSTNGDDKSANVLQLPFTNGIWQKSSSLAISLVQGENTIRFWRDNPPQSGVAIKAFTLTPMH